MLSSLIQSSKETERWVDREVRRDGANARNGSFRHLPDGTTGNGGSVSHVGRGDSNVSRNARHWTHSHQQASNRNHAVKGSPRHNSSRTARRNHPYYTNKNRYEQQRKIGPSSGSYNPAIPHHSYNHAIGRRNDLLNAYHPVSSSQSPAQYQQMSPRYQASPKYGVTSPAYTPVSPVFESDLLWSGNYLPHMPSPAMPGAMAATAKVDGNAMSYSPSPTYAFCSPQYQNYSYPAAVPQPQNQPCKDSAMYSPVYNKTTDRPNTASRNSVVSTGTGELSLAADLSKTIGANGTFEKITVSSVVSKYQLKKKILETIQKANSSKRNNCNTKCSPADDWSKEEAKGRLAYDPTQPQYTPTYSPAALTDKWYEEEARGRLAYDPENPEYW